MGRDKTGLPFSGNIEVGKGRPLDSRMLVDTVADLTAADTFVTDAGGKYLFNGLIVAVVEDNNIYMLTDADNHEDANSWKIIGAVTTTIKTTYTELVTLRDNSELIPGQKYRITDYVTTTSQANTQSAGHQFDIIVEALSENTLSENAKAIQNENDGYFDGANLEAWELKYCLDNDTSRFAWAIEHKTIVTENYRIKPELINGNIFIEPFTFDGQILIDTAEFVYENGRDDIIYEWGYETEPSGEDSLYIIKNGVGYENEGMDYDDKHYYRGTINIEGEVYDKWEKYEVNQGGYYASTGGTVYFLTKSIVEEGSSEIVIGGNGKGVIYYMKDEFNNECPYDFKNIQFVRYKLNPPTVGGYTNEWQNKLSENVNKMFENNHLSYIWRGYNSEYYCWDINSEVCSTVTEETKAFYTFSNIINDEITDKSLTNVCYSNVIKESYENEVLKLNNNIFFLKAINIYCYSNSFGNNCIYNTFGADCNNNTFGNECHNNTFGDGCHNNTFGNHCYENTFSNYCYSNTFGNECTYNTFDYGCKSNTFGNECDSNTFGNDCTYNTFGNECHNNTFGDDCTYNTFGNECDSNTFGSDCNDNTFGNECHHNTFGISCTYNTFGNHCYENTFSNYCYSNSFSDNCDNNTFGADCNSNTFGKYCSFNTFGNDCNNNTFGNSCDWIAFYDDTEYNYKNGKYTYGGEKLDFITNISLGNRCSYLLFYPNSNLGTIGDDNMINNITVIKGIKGEHSSNGLLTLEIPVTNNEYELKVARNINGDIKMYCEANLIK